MDVNDRPESAFLNSLRLKIRMMGDMPLCVKNLARQLNSILQRTNESSGKSIPGT